MIILRSILSVLLGFVAMTVVVVVGTLLAAAATGVGPQGPPTAPYLVLNILLCIPAGLAGGWVSRRLAPGESLRPVWVLAAIVVVFGLMGAMHPEPGQPAWYCWVIIPLGAASVMTGGRAWRAWP